MPRRCHGIALALLLLAGAAVAEMRPEAEPLDALIQRSGLDHQLTNFEAAMQRGITAAHTSQRTLASDDVNRLRKAVATAYSATSLRPVLRIELAKSLTRSEIAAVLFWFDSPTGRKFTALEAKASAPEAQGRLEATSRGSAPAVAPARARILHQLISATRADEVGVSLLIGTAAGVSEGAALFTQGAPSATAAAARRDLEARRGELLDAMHEQSFIAFTLVYAEASDTELAALLAFARSPAGAHYYSASARAVESTLAQAAKRLGGALAAPAAPADI